MFDDIADRWKEGAKKASDKWTDAMKVTNRIKAGVYNPTLLPSNLVCGYTCQDHLLVDLDGCNLRKAKRLARMIMREYPDLGDCLVVRSSDAHYHLIYGSIVTWERLIQVIETLAVLGIVQKAYAQVRTFRRDLTLRISGKNGEDKIRPVPEPVRFITRWNKEEERTGIERYLWALKAFVDAVYPESERL